MADLKRITNEQAHYYKLLDSDKLSPEEICRKSVAFTFVGGTLGGGA